MTIVDFSQAQASRKPSGRAVHFTRSELDCILSVYSFFVGHGVFRDYAIDFLKDRAVFSFFRHSSDVPLVKIEKVPFQKSTKKLYRFVDGAGGIVKQSEILETVLEFLRSKNLT